MRPIGVGRSDVPETVSERVAAPNDGLREVAVDDDGISRCGKVRRAESATGEAGYFIEIEECRIDLVEPGEKSRRPAVQHVRRHLAAFDVHEHPRLLTWGLQRSRDANDARVGEQPSHDLVLAIGKQHGALSLRVLRSLGELACGNARLPSEVVFHRDARRREFLGGEAGTDDAGPQCAPREFGREWQHGHREGHLRDHQRRPCGAEPQGRSTGERTGAEPSEAPRRLQRRHDARHGSPSQREAGDEEQRAVRHAKRQPERRTSGDVLQALRHHHRHNVQDQQRDTSGRDRQHERLDEELPDDPGAAAAEGVPCGELLLPRDGARVVQDGDVGARRQEQQDKPEARQRPEQAQLAAFEVTSEGKCVGDDAPAYALRATARKPADALRAPAGKPLFALRAIGGQYPERGYLGVRLGERRAGREPAEDNAFGTGVAQRVAWLAPQRNPGPGS